MASFTWPAQGSESGGGVTSVGLFDASTLPIFGVSGSPVTTTGTLTLTLQTQTANNVFAGPPSGAAAQPGFRALTPSDLGWLYSTQSFVGTSSQYINFGNNVNIDNTTPFSLVFRINTSTLAPFGDFQSIFKKIDATPIGYDFYLDDDQFALHFLHAAGSNEIRWNTASGTFTKTDAWYTVIVTYTGSSTAAGFVVYIGDELGNFASKTLTVVEDTLTGTTVNAGNLYVGFSDDQVSPFLGEANNFAYYNRVLTLPEATAVYNNNLPLDLTTLSSSSALVHWWKLGNGDNAVASNGFLDSKGTVTGTGIATTASSIAPDAPGNMAGGMASVNPNFTGTLTGNVAVMNSVGIGSFITNMPNAITTTYVNQTVNGLTYAVVDGRYNPPLLQQSFDLWEFAGSPTHYIGAGSNAGLGCSPFKGVFANMIGLGYASGSAIPTNVPGKIKVIAGTPGIWEADTAFTNAAAGSSYQYAAPTTGTTVTIGTGVSVLVVDPAGALLALTITLPVPLIDGQRIRFGSSAAVTTLTVNGSAGTTVSNALGSFVAGGTAEYIYRLTNTNWYRIG